MTTAAFDPREPAATVAEARAAGYTHVYAACSGCGYLVCLPFRMIRRLPGSATLLRLRERMRCERCGNPPHAESVEYWRQSDHTPTGYGGAYRR